MGIYRERERERDRQTDTDRQTDRQIQTDRQTDRHTYTHSHTSTHVSVNPYLHVGPFRNFIKEYGLMTLAKKRAQQLKQQANVTWHQIEQQMFEVQEYRYVHITL